MQQSLDASSVRRGISGEVERNSRAVALVPRKGVLGKRHRTIEALPATNV